PGAGRLRDDDCSRRLDGGATLHAAATGVLPVSSTHEREAHRLQAYVGWRLSVAHRTGRDHAPERGLPPLRLYREPSAPDRLRRRLVGSPEHPPSQLWNRVLQVSWALLRHRPAHIELGAGAVHASHLRPRCYRATRDPAAY